MTLPQAAAARQLKHRRQIDVQVFARGNGLWEVDALLLGCTHITELARVLPTALVQAFADEVVDTRGHGDGASQPFQIDRCHALKSDGEVVRVHYPRWRRAAAATSLPD